MKFPLCLLMLACLSTRVAPAAESPASAENRVPASPRGHVYEVRAFRVEGNTVLAPAKIDDALAGFTGPAVGVARLGEALLALQSLFREAGYPGVGLALPRQEPTNGIVRIIVTEGLPAVLPALALSASTNASSATATIAATNAPVRPAATFAVRGYQLEGNTVLPQAQIDRILTNYIGPAIDLSRLREGLGELQLLYRNIGFATVGLALPPQQLTNGIVRVQVTEGRISDIVVTGNRHFSEDNIRRALPSLRTNVLLNTKWFQPELDRANANADRQIYPVISPGLEPATTALTLKVKDRLPLHGHFEINNKATPDTPPLRLDSTIQYNNLWQREHQAGAQYNFSPQEMKSESQAPRFFDQPSVASYSGFYRMPLAIGGGLRETYDTLPVDFGYDQVTRTIRLPAPTGVPELIVYGSRSASETPTRLGPVTVITNTVRADISRQFAQRDLTVNGNVGARLSLPLREVAGVRSSLSFGPDYKTYDAQTFTTNLTYYSLYSLDPAGNRVFIRRDVIPLDSYARVTLDYIPLAAGWSANRPDSSGSTSLNLNGNLFLAGLASDRSAFQIAAGSPDAGGTFATVTAGFNREQKLPRDWSFVLRATGQWSPAPVIGNEQFALGGTAGVRGYEEGEAYGDSGWRAQFDLRAPPLGIGYFPRPGGDIPVYLRCSWFMDYGEIYRHSRPLPIDGSVEQWGTGVGFYVTAGPDIDARFTLGWALHDTVTTAAGTARAYFSVGLQF